MSGVFMREREGGSGGREGEWGRRGERVFTNRMLFSALYVMLLVCTQYSMYVFPCTSVLLTGSHVPSGPWMVPGRHRQPLQASHSALGKLDRLPVYTHVYKNTHNLTYKYVPVCKCKNTWVPYTNTQNDQYTLTQVYTSGICLATHSIRYYKRPHPLLFLAIAYGGITLTQSASKGQPSGLLIETVTSVPIPHTLTITYIHTEISCNNEKCYSSLYVPPTFTK